MNKNKELVKNTIIIFIGKACTQFITILLLPLYTKYLISSEFGIVDLVITYISLFVPIT
jgi:O-antigen/teichoic acid export membrane protein